MLLLNFIFGEKNHVPCRFKGNAKLFRIINNPDGTIRWLYPDEGSCNSFLNFYNPSNLKGNIYCFFRQVFGRSLRFFDKKAYFIIDELSVVGRLLSGKMVSDYAIFSGTEGYNRKVIIYFKGKEESFIKIPFGGGALSLIENEYSTLKFLDGNKERNFLFPKVINKTSLGLEITKLPKGEVVTFLSDFHLTFIYELSLVDTYFISTEYFFSPYNLREVKNNLINGVHIKEAEFHSKSLQLLDYLDGVFVKTSSLKVSFSHGDFTPWNCYKYNSLLGVFDWEMSGSRCCLFDFFHYIYTANIFIHKKGRAGINRQKLIWRKIVLEKFSLTEEGFLDYEYAYLFTIITYYLPIYAKQSILHKQVYWQLTVWEESLKEIMHEKSIK